MSSGETSKSSEKKIYPKEQLFLLNIANSGLDLLHNFYFPKQSLLDTLIFPLLKIPIKL